MKSIYLGIRRAQRVHLTVVALFLTGCSSTSLHKNTRVDSDLNAPTPYLTEVKMEEIGFPEKVLLERLRGCFPTADKKFGEVIYQKMPDYLADMDWFGNEWKKMPLSAVIFLPESDINSFVDANAENTAENILTTISQRVASCSCPDIKIVERNAAPSRYNVSDSISTGVFLFLYFNVQC